MIDIKFYAHLNKVEPSSLSALELAVVKFHPLFSIFLNFDYRTKRMTRLAILILQMNILLLFIMGALIKLGDESDLFNADKGHLISFCGICSLLTLPLPDCFMRPFRARIQRVQKVTSLDAS